MLEITTPSIQTIRLTTEVVALRIVRDLPGDIVRVTISILATVAGKIRGTPGSDRAGQDQYPARSAYLGRRADKAGITLERAPHKRRLRAFQY